MNSFEYSIWVRLWWKIGQKQRPCPGLHKHQQLLHLERRGTFSKFQSKTAADPCSVSSSLYMWNMDANCRSLKEDPRLCHEMLSQVPAHVLQGPYLLPMKKCAKNWNSYWPLEHCWRLSRRESSGDMGTLPDHLALQRPSCRAVSQENEKRAGRERGGMMTSKSGQAWPSADPRVTEYRQMGKDSEGHTI